MIRNHFLGLCVTSRRYVRLNFHHAPRRLHSTPAPPLLETNQRITEGPSWVTITPQHLTKTPRQYSKNLRAQGRYREAHAVLRRAGVLHTRNQDDLVEYLRVLQHTDEFSGPHQRLKAMLDTIWSVPIRKSQKAFRIVLNACAYEAANVSDNAILKLAAVEHATEIVWQEMRQFRRSIDSTTVAFIYRICGLCRALKLAQRIRDDVKDPVIYSKFDPASFAATSSEPAIAEYILCLGKCGKPVDAERIFFLHENRRFRASPRVLAALFQAYLAASRISKAEALISMNGASFLDLGSCNGFIRQCASLRLFDTAFAFLDRMERSSETGFPPPEARTYNILLHGVSSTRAGAKEHFEQTADSIVARMKAQNIHPTTVTYNTLIRSFVMRNKLADAMDLFKIMDNADRITFSHLMQGAANNTDPSIAAELLQALKQSDVRPTYGFCKSYLHVIAAAHGVDAAYAQAHELADSFAHVLVFGDVGAEEAIRMALIHACGKVGDLPAAFHALGVTLGDSQSDGGPLAPLYVATVLMQACLDCGSEGQAMEVFESLKASGLEPNFEVYESLIKGLCQYVRDSSQTERREGSRDRDVDSSGRNLQDATLDLKSDEELNENREYGMDTGANWDFTDDELHQHDGDITDDLFTSSSDDEIDDQTASRGDGDDEKDSEAEREDLLKVFDETLKLVREMHERGAARKTRRSAFMYNLLIVAAASVGKFDLALEIFRRMTQRSNYRVLYVASGMPLALGGDDESAEEVDEQWPELEGCQHLPAATVNTYNSMMAAAWRCARPDAALMIFNRMQMDRETEPNEATLGLLADIGLQSVDMSIVQGMLSELDRVRLPERISKKRILLRQKTLALRWTSASSA